MARGAHGKKRKNRISFWGHQPNASGKITASCLSQWWIAPFDVNGQTFLTAEHWMMHQKAMLFGDAKTAERILAAKTPADAKKMGRLVAGFSQTLWNEHRVEIAVQGNFHKFGQRDDLKNFLLGTEKKVLVEASPVDTIWGIGLAQDDKRALNPKEWNGLNLLGFALMHARDALRQSPAQSK